MDLNFHDEKSLNNFAIDILKCFKTLTKKFEFITKTLQADDMADKQHAVIVSSHYITALTQAEDELREFYNHPYKPSAANENQPKEQKE